MLLFAVMLASSQEPDPRGPIQTRPAIIGRQSVQSAEAPVSISPEDRGPGIGKWIWLPSGSRSAVGRFRKLVTLRQVPTSIRAWITADVSYRMWIDGHLASRGPADIGHDYEAETTGPWFADVRDISRLFHKGGNVIAVEVLPMRLVQSESTTGQPGLKLDLSIREGNKKLDLGSDESWRVSTAEDLDQNVAKHGFRFDMTKEPANWRSLEFDDSSWPHAVVSEQNRPQTIISELAPPLEAELHPVGVTRISDGVTANPKTGAAKFLRDGSYSIRYGYVLAGYIGLKVNGRKGARLHIMPNEHDAPGFNRQAEVLLRDGEQTLELPFFDSFSVINIQAENVTAPIEIEDVRCVFTSYPVRYEGQFESSSPELNRVWEVCRWVTQICMQTHHLDSPHHQEPMSDAGDYLIESLDEFYAFGDGTLARQDLKKIARMLEQEKFHGFHTSYMLLWLQMLMQYYDYTGDLATVRELAPSIFRLLDQFQSYIGANGLISQAPNYMFMDWVDIDGFSMHHPPAVLGQGYMTALYYRALADGARVADLLGDSILSNALTERRTAIAKAFETELWDPEKGVYRDGKPFQTTVKPNQWLPADKNIEAFSTQVNTFAVTCGLARGDRAKQIMQTILARPDMNCQPYFMHFVFEAMTQAGIFNAAAQKQLARWKIVPDTQSFHEMWSSGDLSHAWNATPLYQMSGEILGVRPTKPGFSEFTIDPHPCGLEWAKGRVPTPHGFINVTWKLAGNDLNVEFTVPKGTLPIVGKAEFDPGSHKATVQP